MVLMRRPKASLCLYLYVNHSLIEKSFQWKGHTNLMQVAWEMLQILEYTVVYHMTRTALQAISLENHNKKGPI